MLSEDAVCGHMETLVLLLLVVCIRNQRPPLLEWEADVSEEFSWLQQFSLFSCLSFERCLTPSPSLPPALPSLCCMYPPLCSLCSSFSPFFLTVTRPVPGAILKSAWWQPPSVGLFLLLRAGKVFLCLHHPTVGHGGSPPHWCQWRRERMRKRGVVVTEALSLYPSVGFGVCHAGLWGLPRWQNPCLRLKRQEEALLVAALCACAAALDGL